MVKFGVGTLEGYIEQIDSPDGFLTLIMRKTDKTDSQTIAFFPAKIQKEVSPRTYANWHPNIEFPAC